jgi:kinesin family member 2/24
VISGINEQTETVTVEWFENEETKGKELDVRHISALNPGLAPAIQRMLQEREQRSAAPVAAAVAAPKAPRASAIPAPAPVRAAAPVSAAPAASAYYDDEDEDEDDAPRGGPAGKARAAKPAGGAAAAAAAGAAKASKVVQEVQKMAEKREARRAQQFEKRDEIQVRVHFESYDDRGARVRRVVGCEPDGCNSPSQA